jgi:hypothetical protein
MLELFFEGWFQCRLARDPDPSDEKRGVSGAAFATVYEPDLDRIIRLNEPVAPRGDHLPQGHQVPLVGVTVKSVRVFGEKNDLHPLVGARVDLLDGAVFQALNGVFYSPGKEPIDPFHISISQGSLALSRKDLWDPDQPDLTMYDMPLDSPLLARRLPVSQEMKSLDVRQATGIFDADAYVNKRVQDLQEAIRERKNAKTIQAATEQQALDLQIDGLQQRLAALTMPPELDLLFESQIDVGTAKSLDDRKSQPEVLLSSVPEAQRLVAEFNKLNIKFSAEAMFAARVDPSTQPDSANDPAYRTYWGIKDPFHWVNPSLGKQPALYSGALDSLLYLPAEFRVEKVLQRGTQYAIVSFQELEVWQSKVFKVLLDSRFTYQFDIRGPLRVVGDLGVVVADDLPWPVTFWMGAWDNDALSGYMKGCLQVPLKRSASA